MRSIPREHEALRRDPDHGRVEQRRQQVGGLRVAEAGQRGDARRAAKDGVLTLADKQLADHPLGAGEVALGAGDAALAGEDDTETHTV
jgi:hypothetical protein